MMEGKTLKVCELDTGYIYEGPRFIRLGPYSGEEFRERHLWPWIDLLKEGEASTVDFAGTEMYSPSFLEESFGGVIRLAKDRQESEKNRSKLFLINFINIKPEWGKALGDYIRNAKHDPELAKLRAKLYV
jgi:hypothetical protein